MNGTRKAKHGQSNGGLQFTRTEPNLGQINTVQASRNGINLDSLDHNNMTKSLLRKKNPAIVSSPTKRPPPPPFRAYPGDIAKSNNGPLRGAVYAEDLEREEAAMRKEFNLPAEIKSEDLMRDEDFLKLDQSKLPLEIFDNIELEAVDRSPAEWMASQSLAKTPYYHEGQWIWRPVTVFEALPETNQYFVQFRPDGIKKTVHRLNLLFDAEDEQLFHERRNVAEAARAEAKKILRLDHFINQQPKELIRVIRQESIRRIHERIILGLATNIPFPEDGTPLGRLLRNLTGETIHFYTRTMKKTVLFSKLVGTFKDENVLQRYHHLRLPDIPAKPPVPLNGKLPCPEYPYMHRVRMIESLHYSSQRRVLGVFRWLYDKWVNKFCTFSFVDVRMEEESLPCSIKRFSELQKMKADNTIASLKEGLRQAFMDQFMDSVQDVFDFFQSDAIAYKTSALYKLFRVLDLRLSSYLRTILSNSLGDWKDMLDNHTDANIIKDKKKSPDMVRQLSSMGVSPHNSEMFEHLMPRTIESAFPMVSRTPLFKVELVITNDEVALEPSLEDIQYAFMQCLESMVSSIRKVTSIDNDCMSLLTIDPRILLNIGAGDPLYADLDAWTKQVKTMITKRIEAAMLNPHALAEMFNEFTWLLEQEVEEYLERFFSEPNPGIEEYRAELKRMDQAIFKLSELAFADETFDLVRVNTSTVRDTLLNKAQDMRRALADLIAVECRRQNIDVIHRYQAILDRIAVKPANEKELSELRDYIQSSRDLVTELEEIVGNVRNRLGMLESFNIRISPEDMRLSWTTLKFPPEVEASGRKVEVDLEVDKIRMMDKLTNQKEDFEKVVEQLGEMVKEAKTWDDYGEREKTKETINGLEDRIADAKLKAADFVMREKVFGFAPTDYSILDAYSEELSPFSKLWNMSADFHDSKREWLTEKEVSTLEGPFIEQSVIDWWSSSFKLAKSLEDDFPTIAECALKLRHETTEFKMHLPVVQALTSKALKSRHWEELSVVLHADPPFDSPDGLTMQMLLDMDCAGHMEEITNIEGAAARQFTLENNLKNMIAEWGSIDFEVKPYKDTYVVGGIDDIMALLDDHIVKTQTMRGNPAIKPILKDCQDWEYKLKYAQKALDQLIGTQRTWMYLEPIFSSEDITKQLPKEAVNFKQVDSTWKKTLAEIAADNNFLNSMDPEKQVEEKFAKANEKLAKITKGLNDYLEMKRLYFPRFFFLSDDELLGILSQTKEVKAVQAHLGKCFEGINKVHFEDDLKITRIISGEGEEVVMDKCVDPETSANKGNVEKWLLELESIQWDSIRTLTVHSLEDYMKQNRKSWIQSWPAQVVLGVSCVYWTQEVTDSLKQGGGEALVACRDKCSGQLSDMVDLVRGKLTKLQRKTLGALTTIDVHNRDVVAKMCDLGITDPVDFEWMSQLRYYWEDAWKDGQAVKKGDKTLVARIVNARCLYGYEYLGNTMRLVVTALTDRCYRTMIGAIDLLYGGAPEGPAGTGKTETVKDLSKAVAIHCVVYNCSDGLDYLAMAKFFKGLAGCGSWCCFDEFNRINVEVLSVIAQQILVINNGKKEMKDMFHFEGTYMKLNNNCNVFITMNPGYAGRAELPDNLKALFRPCAMMVPDYAMIGEIRLYSFGFKDARENAQKIVRTLQLSSEQLSSQKHYDYGMRAVNSILVAAGNLRQALGDNPEWSEAKIVLRSINDVNLAKFLVEDLPLFKGITSDLFPNIVLPTANYGVLPDCMDAVCEKGVEIGPGNVVKLENIASYQKKTIQLYEMVLVRHGVMIVGQTCSGKTSAVHNLAKAMTKANIDGDEELQKVQIYTINPKSVTSGQLYGLFDENTKEFVNGILSDIFRICAYDKTPDRKWMMFDGPVDAVWIENMNTVLDDNKKLCLLSGDIIKMSDSMTMFFEAEDLEQASPATVSRVGMIFCETRNIGWQAVRNIWLDTLPDTVTSQRQQLVDLFDWLYPPISYFVTKTCGMPTQMTAQELIFSMTRLLKCVLDFDDGVASDLNKVVEGAFLFSMIWSVGACVDGKGRKMFSDYLHLALSGDMFETADYVDFSIKNPAYETAAMTDKRVAVPVPDAGLVYDYIFDCKTGKWQNWLEGQPQFKIEKDAAFNSIVVPTIDTIRNEWLLDKLLLKGYHVLCTGDTGTGKTVCVKQKLLKGMPENFSSIFVNFSAQTSANQTQDLIQSKLGNRRKGVVGPPLGNKIVCFVDDLNMPAKEEYGAQPPIEILRQYMDHRGWYERKDREFLRIEDILFCGAMGPPGGGRTRITQRYVRHFNLINFINFSDESLVRVFGTILDWRLSQGFAGPIKQISGNTVEATVKVYNDISLNLLPTPAKSHYTFNLRDLSKVFQGVLQGDPKLVKDKDSFIRIWAHECLRVFHDRLIDDTDRTWFKGLIGDVVKESFSVDYEKVRGPNANLIYANFNNKNRLYAELDDRDGLLITMMQYLEEYNANLKPSQKPMSLVLFESAIEHIARISRVINQPYGNALLVGVGGSGRKSLTTLSVYIAEYDLFTIEITKSYNMQSWREDMKLMMNKAGVDNKPTVFMIDDTQIVKETFLEDINGILNTGEVPNLFNSDELAQMSEAMRKPCEEAGVNTGSQAEVYTYFVQRVRTNLHVVICLSPIGDSFRTRLRMFPSLVNCCTIDWFSEWPEEALRNVANFFLASIDMDEKVKQGVVDVCVDMQTRVVNLSKSYLEEMSRHYYVTPTSYLELINTFKKLLNTQRSEVLEAKARYDSGLAKLLETSVQVNEMQVTLEALQPELQKSTIATDALIAQVTADRKVANEQSAIVAVDAAECNRQKEEAETISAACSKELEAALPALKKAEDALKNLSGKDINEMKQGNNPPYGVKLTMAAVAVMFGIKPKGKSDNLYDAFWDNAKKQLLGNANFLKNLTNYDKDAIDDPLIAKITPYIQFEDFTAETVQKRGSAAAAGLCTWVHAMYTYYNIAKNVKPLKEALKAAQASLAAAQEMYAQKAVALKEVTDKVAALEDALNKAMAEKEALKQKVVDCEAKLKRADALIKGLGGEKTRWTEMSKQLGQTYDNITGDILLSSGVIAYLGAFLASYREKAITQWSALLKVKNITCSDTFSLQTTLGSPVVIRSWTIARLPNDSFSIENAIMLFKSNRWPLMIDPQGQANKWVKKLEEPNSLKVVKQNQSNFVRVLEHAIQFGFPVLLENVPESLDPILESILLKAWTIQGGVPTLRLGDATVEYSLNFKFYITTKLRNPHYPPELCVKVNLLNFMATADGLQDQMLGRVVALEQKELEAQRQALVIEDADNQRQLKEIEDKILFMLKNAKGDILDDEVLIETLGDSKKTSNIIQEKVKIGEQTQVRIAKVRTGYIPVAFQASQLFFCIADLAAVDPMYQYSLDWYMALYESSVEGSEKSKILEERLRNLKSFFSFLLYKNVCRSLFEKDKLLFSFLLTTKIMLGDGNLSPVNLRFFLQGSTSMELSEPNPYSWMSDKSWGDIIEMRELKGFESFPEILATNAAAWSAIVDSNNPADLVSELCGDTFDPFQKLCILRCLRKDVIVPAVMQFIANAPEMGTKFIEPPPFNLRECYSDSKASTPLIFVLTPGAAPMVELQKLAEEEGMGGNKLRAISLGQGQEPIAERAIQDGQDKGTWVCLQNCHLCISWMPALEKICEEFSDELHPNFRLWLTSEPTPSFPPYVLQNGIKMTNEPPKGMRANLLGSFYTIESSWFESCLRKDEFKKMLFGLCFFHAGVRERRKFGPLGWNVQYVFSPPDLQISMDQLRIFLDDLRPEDPVPYAALAYLVGECNYGGRVTDDKDRRCILNILDDFYTDSILDDAYKFSPSGTYYAPPIGDLESFREYIRGLPYSEGPEMFGLHDNANITCAINETNSLLDTALSLQPRAAGGAGKSWGETLSELARDISAKQPKVFDIEKAVIIFPVRYEESMNTVLTQELIRFNRLIVEIATTLREVQKALKGLVVMSGELEDLGNSMVNGKVPKIWTKVSYPSLKGLGPWVSDFLDRITFLSDWMEKGSSPTVFWVSGFFFTQAFITGSLQNFARKMRIPIDKAEFDFRVLTTAEQESAKTRGPEDGSYIRGLFMEGARWDPENHEVSESLPRELFIQMPLIHLDPKPKAEVPIVEGVPEQYTGSRNGTAHVYMCPVYKTSLRQGVLMTTGHSTNFVMFIRLPMNAAQKQKHWIKRGVAMLTQLDF